MPHLPILLLRRAAAWTLLPTCLLLAGCAAATGDTRMNDRTGPDPSAPAAPAASVELPGEGPYQRFIVRYRSDTAAGRDPANVPEQLRDAARVLDPAPALSWQRRLAVGGDVFTVDRPLDKSEARRLMQAFASDPQVESIEVDRRLGIDPPREMRMRGD
ncbi:hypothetical protein [Luteimonas kalidii]|uniref:SPOR domain-containing protein n=1 Tax=Luteimonas kalidii TaxID=3042025 RepID=A0ABT6JR66_9GAMM|nr:hypothetical protein [Luteimonas kalidii]MDH5833170.1 hypothetical protein [Luteimonas kalidii]